MPRSLFATAAIVSAAAISPADAEFRSCDSDALAAANDKATISNATLRQDAINHLTMAKQALADGKAKSCVAHINRALAAIDGN